jgi:hypothetical protein
VLSPDKIARTFSPEQAASALLLIIGLYFPSSINGVHSIPSIQIAFAVLFSLLTYLAWRHGIRREVAGFISAPIMIILVFCTFSTLINRPIQFDWGLFTKFSALAFVLALDLRGFRSGPLVNCAFVLANSLNIACGAAILVGSEWSAEFVPKYYWTSQDELVPSMLSLHKPVLTFGSHSLAGLFLYLFCWVNWEDYRLRGNKLALIFALSYFFLLLGLTSFTSLGLGALALAQMALWYWKRNRKQAVVVGLCVVAIVPLMAIAFADQIDGFRELPELGETFLNSELSGPLARFGPGGSLRGEIKYLFDHPLSPIGLARSEEGGNVESPSHVSVSDSGPLEYLVRGSAPLLFLIYFGLYRFLRGNLALPTHGMIIFLVIIAFEAGFSALGSSRTYFLLPFFVIYLNQVSSASATIDDARRIEKRKTRPNLSSAETTSLPLHSRRERLHDDFRFCRPEGD